MSEELFPKTAEEELATVRAKLQADLDKALDALARAHEKLNDAEPLVHHCHSGALLRHSVVKGRQ